MLGSTETLDERKNINMIAQITKTSFTCELVTIHSKRSFAELTSRIESTFKYYDANTLRVLTAEGDTEKLAAYVKKVGEPTEFAIFFSLDQRFASLKSIRQTTLVINGVHDEMIPVRNSYCLSENLPNAVLLTYPDSGHGSLFQFHEAFTRQASGFFTSDSPFAPF